MYYLRAGKIDAADFGSTTEFLINYIKKTFLFENDVDTSLDDFCDYYDVEHHSIIVKMMRIH